MVVKEGVGLAPPAPIKWTLAPSSVRELEQIARDRSSHRRYGYSRSTWKQGSCSNPILVGLVGELATQELLSSRLKQQVTIVNDKLNNGDGGIDLKIFGCLYQIKTSQKIYASVLVRRIDSRRKITKHTCERYVFCAWKPGEDYCWIIGWCTSDTLREHGIIRHPKVANADWWNVELDRSRLDSINSLVRQIKLEREERE